MPKDPKKLGPEFYCNVSVTCPYVAFAATVLYLLLLGAPGGRETAIAGALGVAMWIFGFCCLIGLLCGFISFALKPDNNRDAWLAVALNTIFVLPVIVILILALSDRH